MSASVMCSKCQQCVVNVNNMSSMSTMCSQCQQCVVNVDIDYTLSCLRGMDYTSKCQFRKSPRPKSIFVRQNIIIWTNYIYFDFWGFVLKTFENYWVQFGPIV